VSKLIWIYGVLAGVIAGSSFYLDILFDNKPNFDNTSVILGYLSMLVGFMGIVIAVRIYKKSHNNGIISFWTALRMGFLIALVAAATYALLWELYFRNFAPDFATEYVNYLREQLTASGSSPAQIEKQISAQSELMADYTNKPFVRLGFTLLEILPLGIAVSILNAWIQSRFFNRDKG